MYKIILFKNKTANIWSKSLFLYIKTFDLYMTSITDLVNSLTKNSKCYSAGDNCNIITDKMDFTKKEDLDKLRKAVNDLKNDNNPFVTLVKDLAGPVYTETLDTILANAENEYKNAQKSVLRPSAKLNDKSKEQISKITKEYIDTIIVPNFNNINKEQVESITDALFEFACWIYTR